MDGFEARKNIEKEVWMRTAQLSLVRPEVMLSGPHQPSNQNDNFSRQLKTLLGLSLISRQLHMKNTVLTDFYGICSRP